MNPFEVQTLYLIHTVQQKGLRNLAALYIYKQPNTMRGIVIGLSGFARMPNKTRVLYNCFNSDTM